MSAANESPPETYEGSGKDAPEGTATSGTHVKVIPHERLERARAKKYGFPYDPAQSAWIKSYVRWKKMNFDLMNARDASTPPRPSRRGRK
jgi:hypothetical protein